jgi:hypothetical protein
VKNFQVGVLEGNTSPPYDWEPVDISTVQSKTRTVIDDRERME